jgi:hypothetical protein
MYFKAPTFNLFFSFKITDLLDFYLNNKGAK